jgi:integrase/recombinase XerC
VTVLAGAKALEALQRWLALRTAPVSGACVPGLQARRRRRSSWAATARALTAQLDLATPEAPGSLQAGLATPVHPHMLRHSFCQPCKPVQQRFACRAGTAGPANISTTDNYTRLDFQHLAKAYDAACIRVPGFQRQDLNEVSLRA